MAYLFLLLLFISLLPNIRSSGDLFLLSQLNGSNKLDLVDPHCLDLGLEVLLLLYGSVELLGASIVAEKGLVHALCAYESVAGNSFDAVSVVLETLVVVRVVFRLCHS